MASDADFLTTHKNGVVAINAISAAINSQNTDGSYYHGQYTSAAVTSSTVICTGSGFLVNISIIDAGSTEGTVNNAATTGAVATANGIVKCQKFHGVYQVGARFTAGLVVVPGTGQTVSVTYSLD